MNCLYSNTYTNFYYFGFFFFIQIQYTSKYFYFSVILIDEESWLTVHRVFSCLIYDAERGAKRRLEYLECSHNYTCRMLKFILRWINFTVQFIDNTQVERDICTLRVLYVCRVVYNDGIFLWKIRRDCVNAYV